MSYHKYDVAGLHLVTIVYIAKQIKIKMFLKEVSYARNVCMYVCIHVCTKSPLKTTTNSLCVYTWRINSDSDSEKKWMKIKCYSYWK